MRSDSDSEAMSSSAHRGIPRDPTNPRPPSISGFHSTHPISARPWVAAPPARHPDHPRSGRHLYAPWPGRTRRNRKSRFLSCGSSWKEIGPLMRRQTISRMMKAQAIPPLRTHETIARLKCIQMPSNLQEPKARTARSGRSDSARGRVSSVPEAER
jgi:hypothetical protein